MEIHSDYQNLAKTQTKNTRVSVKSEYRVNILRKIGRWKFVITGRTDLVQISGNVITVEEIKSVNNLKDFTLNSEAGQLYQLQLLFYAHYFKETYPDKKIQCKLVVIDVFSQEETIHSIQFKNIYEILDEKCKNVLTTISETKKHEKKQQQRAHSINFPFETIRPHQDEIIHICENVLNDHGNLMLLAPSGLGKTVGTLFPALRYTIDENKRLFVVTSKTTQQKIYEDTLRLFARNKGKFNSIILTAKEKMCLNTTYACDPALCKYAQSYPANYEDILKSILKNKVINSKYVKKKAKEHKICPFELALDCSLFCDVIVGDYNYVFSPIIKLQRFFKGKYKDCICIIDEAHNLPERAREYYSPEISEEFLTELVGYIQNQAISADLRTEIVAKLQDLMKYIQTIKSSLENPLLRVTKVPLDLNDFSKFLDEFENLLVSYLGNFVQNYEMEPLAGDLFTIFVKQLHFFLQILEQTHLDEFEPLIYPQEGRIKIYCKSAANFLKTQMKGFHSVIVQSATLYPVGYYKEMLGLPEDTKILQYSSPFPLENRLYMDFPYVSTRYMQRESSYHTIAQLIHDSIRCQSGNYLVFFPSFHYLYSVLKELQELPSSNEVIVQQRRMSEKARRQILSQLRSQTTSYLLLGVHGGIFSEGVDYPGDMAIGVFIISPGLPQYCFEQELIKEYFQKQYYRGFEFAYRNPGLTRVIQAAGRIFRSETDRGFVVLIGQRFHTNYYRSVLPKDWDIETPEDLPQRVKKFWNIHKDNLKIKCTSRDIWTKLQNM